jgi:hypothetical protein
MNPKKLLKKSNPREICFSFEITANSLKMTNKSQLLSSSSLNTYRGLAQGPNTLLLREWGLERKMT